MENHNHPHVSEKTSPSSVYYCPMECEGEKLYFSSGKRCPVCNMFLLPIEERADYKGKPKHITEPPKNFDQKTGEFYCPMFCENDKTYAKNVGCPICGMDLVQIPSKNSENEEDKTFQILKKKFIISLGFTIPVFILSMGEMFFTFPFSKRFQGFLELLLSLPVLFYSGWFLMKRGINSFKNWNLNMFSLIALGVFAAFIFSLIALIFPSIFPHEIAHKNSIPLYFEAVCVILTLVIMGQMMEANAHQKTGNAIKELMNLSPDEANLILNETEKKIPLSEVKMGDILRVKPGEKIPVDGRILEGTSTIDESMITGEPIALEKKIGEKVNSGTINGNGVFLMIAEKVGDETLLSQIIKMVNEASRSKAPIQKVADKVAKIFVPAVIGISILTFILWMSFGDENKLIYAFVNAVSVLIVACPCALGLATPMSLMVGIGKGARNGILIKNAETLEQMAKVNVLITDKTGTLTEGKPSLNEIFALNKIDENLVLKLAASLNQNSEHPLSSAVLNEFKKEKKNFEKVENFENISGKGLKGIILNETILLGNEAIFDEFKIKIPENIKQKGMESQEKARTVSYLSKGENVLGFLSFSDQIKANSKQAVAFLQKNKVDVIMMSGDNEPTAKAVAMELGIKKYFANQLPKDKWEEIKKLQNLGKIVAMTGDGINDAPALAQANVGIAMGTGTNIAMESAEITLLKGDILGAAKAKILSEKLLKNIKQNLFFAFIYNILGIPVAAGLPYPIFGIMMSPMLAAAAMSISSVSVILNSLRLNGADLEVFE